VSSLHPRKGDLVIIHHHESGEFGDDVDYNTALCGIVVSDVNETHQQQLKIFPEVNIYILKTESIVPIPVSRAEIISDCHRRR